MQLQSQLERRQLHRLIGLQKIGRLLLETGGDLLNLVTESGYRDHQLSDGSGVRTRRRQQLLQLLLGLGHLVDHRLKRLSFLLLKLNQALNLRVREVQELFQVRGLRIGGRVLGEQGGSRQKRQEKSRNQNGLLLRATYISGLKKTGYMTQNSAGWAIQGTGRGEPGDSEGRGS